MLTWRPKDRGWESHVLMVSSSTSSTERSAEVSLDGVLGIDLFMENEGDVTT